MRRLAPLALRAVTTLGALGALGALGGCGDDVAGDGGAGDLAAADRALRDQAQPRDNAVLGDAAPIDQSVPADAAAPDDQSVPADLAALPDLVTLADLIRLPDLTVLADLTVRPDLTSPPADLTVLQDMTAPPPDLSPATHTVTVAANGNLAFSPSALTIAVGDTVKWVWASSGHTVTSGAGAPDGLFCSPNDMNCATAATSNAGATYSHTFSVAGTFPYFCRPHAGAGMTGSIKAQ